MLTTKDLLLVLGLGVPVGLVAAFSNVLGTVTYADQQTQRSRESEQELLQAQAIQAARREQLEGSSNPTVQESAQELAMNEIRSILSRPHTPHEAEMALQILNGRTPLNLPPSQPAGPADRQAGYSDYGRPSYTGSATSTGMPISSQSGSSYRSGLDQPSASRAWLEQQEGIVKQRYGPAKPDLGGDSSVNNIGAINVRTGQYYAPAGAGYVNPQDGTYYAPAGPTGVVDTRTGAFIPKTP